MLSEPLESLTAEERFRQAFERLKKNQPIRLTAGTAVSQNNVAKEAGCDPSALKKTRFPDLVREIKAYIDLQAGMSTSATSRIKARRAANRTTDKMLADAKLQRDAAQSRLASANSRITELIEENRVLQQELDRFRPPPIKF